MAYVIYHTKEDGSKEYLYKTSTNQYIYHSIPNIYFGSEEAAMNFIDNTIIDRNGVSIEETPAEVAICMAQFDADMNSTLDEMCERIKNAAETITFPPLQKNMIQTIDKKDIPVTIAKDPFDINAKRDILAHLARAFILDPGEEWHNPVDDMTDEQVNDFTDMLARSFERIRAFKKEEVKEISEQWEHRVKVLDELTNRSIEILDGLIPDYILERLKEETNTCPETREDIIYTAREFLKAISSVIFDSDDADKKIDKMSDEEIVKWTIQALKSPDDTAVNYYNLLTGDDKDGDGNKG